MQEKYLTIRWNNILSFVLGVPTMLFAVYALSASAWSDKTELIVLSVIGVMY